MRITLAHELETAVLIPDLTVWLSLELKYAITVDRRARELEFGGIQSVRVTGGVTVDDETLVAYQLALAMETVTPEWLYTHYAAEMAALEEAALEEAHDTLADEAAHEADSAYTEWKETR